MGARQSKRSVDITGKEGEAVVANIAPLDGEARLEKIAELDTAKPQLNGDAHIEAITPDKEKHEEVEVSATPENEKDKSNEKDMVIPHVNGTENGDTTTEDNAKTPDSEIETPTTDSKVIEAENNKKTKKEKVKKKWSFRSISFSKKDKQKPDKKKEENGEYAQVPEETQGAAAAEAATESSEKKPAEESPKAVAESGDKAPETPAAEPAVNGVSSADSPAEEAPRNGGVAPGDAVPVAEVAAAVPVAVPVAVPIPVLTPETRPPTLEGLHVEDIPVPAEAVPVPAVVPEAVAPEAVPEAVSPVVPESSPSTASPLSEDAPEIPPPALESPEPPAPESPEAPVLIAEVCAEAPPLPAGPPPSSLAAFAESTMGPEEPRAQPAPLTDDAVAVVSPAEPPPAESSPAESSPAESFPVETSPTESTPAELTPAESTPTESGTVESAPVESSPSESSPAGSTPPESALVESAPVEASPTESGTVESSPAESGTVESSPVELSPKLDPVDPNLPDAQKPKVSKTLENQITPVESTVADETIVAIEKPIEIAPVETLAPEASADSPATDLKEIEINADRILSEVFAGEPLEDKRPEIVGDAGTIDPAIESFNELNEIPDRLPISAKDDAARDPPSELPPLQKEQPEVITDVAEKLPPPPETIAEATAEEPVIMNNGVSE